MIDIGKHILESSIYGTREACQQTQVEVRCDSIEVQSDSLGSRYLHASYGSCSGVR